MQEKISQKVEETIAEPSCNSDESCVNWAASVMKEVCKGMDCHLLWQKKFKWAAFNNQDPKNAEVKFQAKGVTYKMNLLLGARGYIRSKLDRKELFNEKGQAVSFLGYDKNLDELVSLISTFGVQSEGDRKTAFKYFSGVVTSEKDFCNGPDGLNRERCINQYNAVLGLAAVATTADSKAQAANQIYKLFKSYWPLYIYKDNQTIILENTFLALAAIDTDDSWAKINAIFTTDTQPTVMARGMEAVSIEFLTRTAARVKAIQTWGSTSYRNLGNAELGYVDTQEDKRQGTRTKSQKPYGNIIEDIGRAIAIEAGHGNPRAAKVASQAMAKANTWAKSRKQSEITRATNASFHWPFIVGILDGYYEFGEKYMYAADIKLLEFLRFGDFWDLNEGTQRRIRYKAWRYAAFRQKKWKSGWHAPTLDKDKVTRSEQTATATKWASYADIALIVVGAAAAIRKIGVVSKGMSKCLSIMKKGKKLMGKNMNFAKTTGSTANTAKTTKTTSAAAKSTSSASQGAKQTTAKAASSAKAAPKPAAKPGTSATSARAAQTPAAKPAAAASGESATTSARTSTAQKAAASAEKSAAVSPAKLEQQVTGPLDQQVAAAAAGESGAANGRTSTLKQMAQKVGQKMQVASQYIKDGAHAYLKSLNMRGNYVMMSLPGIPQPGAYGKSLKAIREARVAKATTALSETETAVDKANKAAQALADAEKELQSAQAAFEGAGWGADGSRLLQAEKNLDAAKDFVTAEGRAAERARKKLAAQNRYVESFQKGKQTPVENAQMRLDNRTAELKAIRQNTALQKTDPETWAQLEEEASTELAKASEELTAAKKAAATAEKAPAATTGKAATATEKTKEAKVATRKAEEASKAKAAEETRKAQAANTNNPVSKVEKVTHLSSKDLRLRAVWKLEAEEGKTIGYAKFGTQEEVSRTKAVREILDGDEVVKGGLRQRYKQIEVEYPRILADNFESLPQGARDIIEADVKEIKSAKSFRAADTRLQDGFVTSPVDASGVNMGDLQMQQLGWKPWLTSGISEAEAQATVAAKTRSYLLQQLDYQPVSQAEWQEVEDLIKALNDAGFEHRDLAHNMFIKRNPATRKLKLPCWILN